MANKQVESTVLEAVKKSPEYAAMIGAGVAIGRDADKGDMSDAGSKESDRVSQLHQDATAAYIKKVYSELAKQPGYGDANAAYAAALQDKGYAQYQKIHDSARNIRQQADLDARKVIDATISSGADLGSITMEGGQSFPCVKSKTQANCR